MKNNTLFFSDPKVIISLFALLISIIGFIWTLVNQWEQNRRWEKLNAANVILKEVKFFNWKELTKEQAMSIKWGYDPSLYGGEPLNKYEIPYHLVVRDVETKEKVAGINVAFSIPEVEHELERINYKRKVFLTRLFRPKFVFENSGKTDAIDLSIKIDAKQTNQEWQHAFSSNTNITLATEQLTTIYFDIEIPLNVPVPTALSFLIKLKYLDVNANVIQKETKAKWTSADNFWSYGEQI